MSNITHQTSYWRHWNDLKHFFWQNCFSPYYIYIIYLIISAIISSWLIKHQVMPLYLLLMVIILNRTWIMLKKPPPFAFTPCWNQLKRSMEEKTRGESHGGSKGRERCYERNEKPTHVHINVLHSTMSPSHRKKGSIYRQYSGPTVPSWSVSEEQVVFPFQGLSPWLILLAYRRDPQLRFTSEHFRRCTRCRREL